MTFPIYTRREVAADTVIHALGLGLALIAGPVLIALVATEGEGGGAIAAVSVYVATLVLMLASSAAYNLVRNIWWKGWLQRLDHSAIYLKIAGAYTPFAAISMGGGSGKIFLTGVWLTALTGLALKILWPRRFYILSIVLYLALGWSAVLVAGDVADNLRGATIALLIAAGLVYSSGVIVHLWSSLPYHNAIWHAMVLAGTAVIYAAMVVEFA